MSKGLDSFMRPDVAKTPAAEGESNVVPMQQKQEAFPVFDSVTGAPIGSATSAAEARAMIARYNEARREVA